MRELGKSMHIPHEMLWRHPFPGPGLSVRVPGEVTRERLDILREADAIYMEELRNSGWYEKIWQACTVLLNCKTGWINSFAAFAFGGTSRQKSTHSVGLARPTTN